MMTAICAASQSFQLSAGGSAVVFSSLKVNCTFGYPTECAAIVVNNKMVKFVNLLFWFLCFLMIPRHVKYVFAGRCFRICVVFFF